MKRFYAALVLLVFPFFTAQSVLGSAVCVYHSVKYRNVDSFRHSEE